MVVADPDRAVAVTQELLAGAVAGAAYAATAGVAS
jgi:hypothetical protein